MSFSRDLLAEEFVLGQLLGDEVGVGQLGPKRTPWTSTTFSKRS
jgi:hypothetical protein